MLALWLGIAWPALAGGPFVINGKLAGVEDGAVVRLFRPDGSMGAAVAADTLRNGRFMLCGEVEQLEMLSIAVQGEGFPSMGLNVWVEPDAVVSVSGRDKLLVTWKVASKIPQQAEANRYIDASRSEYVQMQQAAVEFSALAGSCPAEPVAEADGFPPDADQEGGDRNFATDTGFGDMAGQTP